MSATKQEIITFKVDPTLAEAIRKLPNASAFIRHAILSALDHVCPLCQGSGILTPKQQEHWRDFAKDHKLVECDQCHAMHFICECEGEHHHTHPEPDPQR
ncbi:MAG: CopG family transcriptional regulator [Verrucomicrobiota bacterium]|nr:CopG family transcriptional regulator [Verrucomicrobiota bacterium]